MSASRLGLLVGALFSTLVFAVAASAENLATDAKLPEPVEKTFRVTFPDAVIQKLSSEVEEGVTVYDFEFKDGEREKETDIAADGTMLEWTLVIPSDAVPEPIMKVFLANAKGGKLGRLERIEVDYELADAKAVKLSKQLTRYAAEMTKGSKKAEVIVNSDGSVFEKPEWVPIEPKPAAK
jgi:hypothetical protein